MSDNLKHKRIILFAKPGSPQVAPKSKELLAWLNKRVTVVANNIENRDDIKSFPDADYAIVIGGDGSVLSTVRKLDKKQIPIIGVDMGKLGFLLEFSIDELKTHFEQLLSDKTLITDRMMFDCLLTRKNESKQYLVVNEISISAGRPFQMIEVGINIGEELLGICRGDGLVVSTPTGSTAHNLAAGGPILDANIIGAIITPLVPHSLSFRPVVVSLDTPIIVTNPNLMTAEDLAVNNNKNRARATLLVDGVCMDELSSDDIITITKSMISFKLVRHPELGRWRLLNSKLRWGASPNYNT